MAATSTWFPSSPEELTAGWLSGILQASGAVGAGQEVTALSLTPIGQGAGMMGSVTRVGYQLSGGDGDGGSLVVKSASDSETNRGVAQTFRLYEREVRFYRELAPALEGMVPRCHFAEVDSAGGYMIVLEDLVGYRCGDQVAGCGPDEARVALRTLARFHATFWGRPAGEMPAWVPPVADDTYCPAMVETTTACWPVAVERFGHLLPDALTARVPDFVAALPGLYRWMGSGPQTLAHTDFRLDNLLFSDGHPDRPLVVLDWSSVLVSRGAHDVAFLLSQNLTTEHRRRDERDLVAYYHQALAEQGVTGYTLEQCWSDYERACLFELMYALVIGGALDVSDPRANAFVSALVERCAATITDLDLLDLLAS